MLHIKLILLEINEQIIELTENPIDIHRKKKWFLIKALCANKCTAAHSNAHAHAEWGESFEVMSVREG